MSNNAVIFVTLCVGLLFDIYTIILLLRFLLQLLAPNYHNPLIRKIFNYSAWLNSLHRILPNYKKFDMVLLLAAVVLQLIKIFILIWLRLNNWLLTAPLIPWALASTINQIINIFFYALLLRVLLSYMNYTIQSPLYEMLYVLTEPLLRPFRKWFPNVKGWDFTPLIAAVILKAIAVLLLYPILSWSESQALLSLL